MNRPLALLFVVIGGGAAAFTTILGLVGVVGGVLWLYVLGDDPWPAAVEQSLNLAVPLVGLVLWAVFSWLMWRWLMAPRREG